MKSIRKIALPDEALTMINLEFQISNQYPKNNHFFQFLNKVIDENAKKEFGGNWNSFLFKNYFFFTQINDLEIVMTEFASEEYCRIIKKIIIFAFDSMGLYSFINFKKLPKSIQKEFKEKISEGIQEILNNNKNQINQKNVKKVSFAMPWRESKLFSKISNKIEPDVVFQQDEEGIDVTKFDEENVKNEISELIKKKVKKLSKKIQKLSKKINEKYPLETLNLEKHTLFLRDYVKNEFYKESELKEIQKNLVNKQKFDNPFKLSNNFIFFYLIK
jgi:hypothetical protein